MSSRCILSNNCHEIYNLPENITEVYYGKINISKINMLTEILKKYNRDIKLIILIPSVSKEKNNFEKIIDKKMVLFEGMHGGKQLTISDMIEIDKMLDLMTEDIRKSNLSNYEKYIVIYYIVRNYKIAFKKILPYESWSVYYTLLNDYIVCAGYTSLLSNLLFRVGLTSDTIAFSTEKEDHAIVCTNINDTKYDLNGYYFGDPTYDNQSEHPYDKFFSLAGRMNMSLDELMSKGKYTPRSTLIKYWLSAEIIDCIEKKPYDLLELSNIEPELYEKIKPFFYKKTCRVESLIMYLNSKMYSENIPIKKQYQALLQVKQFIEGRKYPSSEYLYEWNELVGNDLEFGLLIEVPIDSDEKEINFK